MGNGSEEFEVGFWALRDIRAGEEVCLSLFSSSISCLRAFLQLSYNYNFDSFTTIKRPPTHPEFVEAALQRRQRCLCGAPNCVGWLGKEPAESNKNSPEENIAPELRGLTGASEESAAGVMPKKILLKVGASSSSVTSSRTRGTKRQATAEEEIDTSRKRASAPVSKGKGKAKAQESFPAEAAQADDVAEYPDDPDLAADAALHPDLAEQYLTEELHSTAADIPAPHNLAALLNPTGEDFVDEAYMEAEQFPAADMYAQAEGYQEGDMSYSEANPDEYVAEAEAQSSVAGTSERKTLNKGKGVRVIEKHRRKTKYGLIWKSDAELELERR